MKQFGRLLHFELKKIFKRKGTWITLGILTAFSLAMHGGYLFGSTYVEGEFLETHLEQSRIERENGLKLSGRKIDDTLLKEMQDAYAGISDMDDARYMLTEEYQTKVRPYSGLYYMISDSMRVSGVQTNPFTVTQEQFYEAREQAVIEKWEKYGLTDSEKSYWQKKEDKLEKPFTYQYSESYNYLVSMSGVYRVYLLVTFLIGICMSGVFTEEHGRKTDQLILCSRLGRKQVYFAKIAAGSLFGLFSTVILLLLIVIIEFAVDGTEGFSAAVQLFASHSSETLTIGQIFLIMVGILLFSSALTCIFTMVLSEITRSNIASMAVVIAGMFIARLLAIPYTYRVLSQAWNYIPINLLKFDAGFWDLRLIPLFGLKLTSWQAAPVLYVVFGILLVLIGKKAYCGYQVQGR